MRSQRSVVLEATAKALRMRQDAAVHLSHPICPYDLADRLGVDVWFTDCASMEGMYAKAQKAILVSALRPAGRQRFTCAHELGHHAFGHGTRVDELLNQDRQAAWYDPDEFAADSFAAALLMPKTAVSRGFAVRGWRPEEATAVQAYTVAGWLGVGYATLLQHMSRTLSMLSRVRMTHLLGDTPKSIRQAVLGTSTNGDLLLVDEHWEGRALDLQVGDLLMVPTGTTVEGDCVGEMVPHGRGFLCRAASPGTGRLCHTDIEWSAYIRVSRRAYVGRAAFRHLEDPDDD